MNDFEGPVTVLFTDIEGSTELRTRLGDEGVHELLRSHEELVRKQVSEHGGREIKALGDGFMVAFTSARRAVACAASIQKAVQAESLGHSNGRIKVRIGLNTGEVIVDDGDLYGEAIHAAARIAARAKGGQILAASVVKEITGTVPGVSFVDRGRVRLKGFPDRRQLYEIEWEQDRDPTRVEGKTPLVGREAERSHLLRHIENALAGQGGLVVIGGEPGVGKTRLCEEIAAEGARRGMLTLAGHCYETDSAPPYIAFVEILENATRGAARSDALRQALGDVAGEVARIVPELRRVFPDIPAPVELPPDQERRYLFNSITEFMQRAAAIRPQLIVLDDLQWADEPTLLLVRHLAERLHEIPMLILGTYRDVELDVARPLANMLEELLRQRLAHRIALKRLPEQAVGEMLKGLAGAEPPAFLASALFEETEGNPFFVEEVFKYLVEGGKLFDENGRWRRHLQISELEVPEGVRLVIGRRLERLNEETRRVLAAAATIGRGFSYDLLEALREVDGDTLLDAIDEAERARLITSQSEGSQDRITFAHELIRQTLLSGLSAPRRRKLHLRVADAIESVNKDKLEDQAADLAYHLEQAGALAEPGRVVTYLRMAGDRALEAAAFEDALRYFENALSLQDDDRRARAELLYRLGLTQRSLGNIEDALDTWNRSLADFEALADKPRIGELCSHIAQQLAWASLWPESIEMAARGLNAVDDVSSERTRLLGLSAIMVTNTGYFDEGTRLLTEAVDMAATIGDEVLTGYVKLAEALVRHTYYDLERAVDLGLEGGRALRESGDWWDYASFMGFIQFAAFFLGRWDQAQTIGDELEPLARRLGHTAALVFSMRSRPIEAFLVGDLDGMEKFNGEDLALSREVGPLLLSQALLFKALNSFRRGDWSRAEAELVEADDTRAPGFWWQLPWAYLLWFRCHAGPREQALDMFEAAREHLPHAGKPNHWGAWNILAASAEGLAIMGEREKAAELYPLVVEWTETGVLGRGFDLRLTQTVAGIAAAAAEDWDGSTRYFEAATARATELGMQLELMDIALWSARALVDRGRPEDADRARMLLKEASDGYRRVGAPKHLEMAARVAD